MIVVEIVTLSCPGCGQKILISNPVQGRSIGCGCGEQLTLIREGHSSSNPGILRDLGIFALGAFTLGAFIWTGLGREFAKEAISRGAGVTRTTVEGWIRKGR